MPEDIKKSYNASKELTHAWDILVDKSGKLNFDKLSSVDWVALNTQFQKLGQNIGLTYTESGKIGTINLDQFSASLSAAGYSAEEIRTVLGKISEENPEARITIDGAEVAEKDVQAVMDYLAAVNGADADATITIDGVEYAVEDLSLVNGHLEDTNGKKVTADVNVNSVGADKVISEAEKRGKEWNDSDFTARFNVDEDGSAEGLLETFGGDQVIEKILHITGQDDGASATVSQVNGMKVKPKTMTVRGKTDSSFTGARRKYEGVKKNRSVTLTVGGKIASSLNSAIARMKAALKLGGQAKGTRNAPEGLSEVNERGWEFIRDAKTGKLRIAGGGKRTVTYLNKGDAVYTHEESKRMISGKDDVHISQHAKGKSNTKSKKKAQKSYDEAYEKRKTAYENAVKTLEYKASVQHWSDQGLANAIQKAYNTHIKALKTWNSKNATVQKWRKAGAKVKASFGTDLYREQVQGKASADYDKRIANIEKSISSLGLGKGDAYLSKRESATKISQLEKQYKSHLISADDYIKYRDEINKAYINSALKMYKAGKKTYKDMKSDLDD